MGRDVSAGLRAEFDRRISALEEQVDEDVATLGLLEQQWESYRQAMGVQAARFEEIGGAAGSGNPVTQREVAAVREIAAYAERLAWEQEEVRAEAARARRADAEAEIEGLRRERGALPWG